MILMRTVGCTPSYPLRVQLLLSTTTAHLRQYTDMRQAHERLRGHTSQRQQYVSLLGRPWYMLTDRTVSVFPVVRSYFERNMTDTL
jgi:hypothetical protein